jgi:hypothetical protein
MSKHQAPENNDHIQIKEPVLKNYNLEIPMGKTIAFSRRIRKWKKYNSIINRKNL